jgi:hypothetical protein
VKSPLPGGPGSVVVLADGECWRRVNRHQSSRRRSASSGRGTIGSIGLLEFVIPVDTIPCTPRAGGRVRIPLPGWRACEASRSFSAALNALLSASSPTRTADSIADAWKKCQQLKSDQQRKRRSHGRQLKIISARSSRINNEQDQQNCELQPPVVDCTPPPWS